MANSLHRAISLEELIKEASNMDLNFKVLLMDLISLPTTASQLFILFFFLPILGIFGLMVKH